MLLANRQVSPADVQPLLDLIGQSDYIEIIDTTPTSLKIRITAPLQYFTENDFVSYENNENSEYNRHFKNKVDKTILHKLFVTRDYQLLAEGIVTIALNNSWNTYSSPISFEAQRGGIEDFKNFPNPHLYHHNCWSAAKTEIMKNLNKDQYDLVVLQMIAAIQTINIAEHASFVNGLLNDFDTRIFHEKMHFIDKDKNTYTYGELYDKIKKEIQQGEVQEAAKIIEEAPKDEYTQVELPDDGDWPDLATVTEQLNDIVVNHDRNTVTINGNEIPIANTTATAINPINTTTYYATNTTATQGIQGV